MSLSKLNYLTSRLDEEGEKIYHIKTPCRFIFRENVVEQLRSKYLPNEEIGGIIWVAPEEVNGECVFIADKVSFIRNAIEDTPNARGRTKKNTYRMDTEEYYGVLQEVFRTDYLPIKFHTHPTKGNNFVDEFLNFSFQRETSEQDKKSSSVPLTLGKEKLLMPCGLVVGNDAVGDRLFIGLYNGFIAPQGFQESRNKVIEENMNKVGKVILDIELTKNQKVLLTIGAILLLAAILRYRKYSIPVILSMSAIIPNLLSDTEMSESPKYYSQLCKGDAIIEIPHITN